MEPKRPKSFLSKLRGKYLFMIDEFSGLYSIAREDNRFISISKIMDQEEEKQTVSTTNTKSSNFSHDSIMKSLFQMSQINLNHIKEIKESLKKPDKNQQIFGNYYAKEVLKETFFLNKLQNKSFKLDNRSWRLVLLYGPPGVGKTMISQTTASQTDRTVFWVSISNLISRFMGETEKLIETLFELAKEHQPSLVVIEEVDSIGRVRNSQENDAERRLKIEFLKQLDGVANCEEDIIFLGTTNLPWDLDVAFLRRFERKVFVPLLNKKERIEMLKFNLEKQFNLTKEDFQILGELTIGLTGSEIKNYIRHVMIKVSTNNNLQSDIGFFLKLLKNHQPSVSKRLMGNYIKFLSKYGESEQLQGIDEKLYKQENLDYIL